MAPIFTGSDCVRVGVGMGVGLGVGLGIAVALGVDMGVGVGVFSLSLLQAGISISNRPSTTKSTEHLFNLNTCYLLCLS